MAFSQRPASRFYAAFYRWSRYAQRPPPCSLSSRYSGVRLDYLSIVRNYHTTPRLRQYGQPEPQLQNDEAEPVIQPSEIENGISERLENEQSRPAASVQEPSIEQRTPSSEDEGAPMHLDLNVDTEQLKTEVRTLMRKVPSSVSIITAASVDPDTQKHVPMGVAVSSLSTVTLDPPTISFNLKQPSKTLDAIRTANGLFRVHFLEAERSGATVVDHFCRGNHREAYAQRFKHTKIVVPRPGRNPSPSKSYAPQIYGDAIRSSMECKLTHELPVADHVILVAQVNSLKSKLSTDPTLVYVDGSYMRADGTKLSSYSKPYLAPASLPWSAWHYPLFPGEVERLDYVSRLRATIKESPEYASLSVKEVCRKISATWPVPPKMFGVNLDVLVAECKREAGQNHDRNAMREHLPVLADFYGPLNASQVAKIVDRARALVKQKPQSLNIDYIRFLRFLGLGPISTNLLPSDILKHLRAEGLIDPVQPAPVDQTSKPVLDILYYEQVEQKLREHLRSLKFEDVIRDQFEGLLAAVGETQDVARVLRPTRWRLHVEAAPELFDDSKMDITGEVSEEEIRVILHRLVDSARVNSMRAFWKWLNTPWIESLRRVGISPRITGINLEFLFGKITHLYHTTPQFRDLAEKVDQMLEPWFDKTVTWEVFQDRVKRFVQRSPLRAMSWSNKDKFAAIGIHKDARISTPSSENEESPSQDHMLEMLVAKELRNHYSNATEKESRVIAAYLKKQYNYDVQGKGGEISFQDLEPKLKDDVLLQKKTESLTGYSLDGGKKKKKEEAESVISRVHK